MHQPVALAAACPPLPASDETPQGRLLCSEGPHVRRPLALCAHMQVCNRVTGLLSPDADAHTLTGALVYGSGFSDAFLGEWCGIPCWLCQMGSKVQGPTRGPHTCLHAGPAVAWLTATPSADASTDLHRGSTHADVRSADSNWVGIENNAGLAGAVAAAAELPEGLWEVCLQKYGIYRSNPVCGSFISI